MIAVLDKMTPENGQAVGILTHHLVHDDCAWQFLEKPMLTVGKRLSDRILGKESANR